MKTTTRKKLKKKSPSSIYRNLCMERKKEAHTPWPVLGVHPLPLSTQEKLKLSCTVSVRRRPSPKYQTHNTARTHIAIHTHTHTSIHPQLVSFVLFHSLIVSLLPWTGSETQEIARSTAAHSTNSILVIKTNKANNDGVLSYNNKTTTQWYWWATQHGTQHNRISLYATTTRTLITYLDLSKNNKKKKKQRQKHKKKKK